MLLGRAYAGAGKGGEAEGVFDALIAAYPNDFRGYLAKVGSTRVPVANKGKECACRELRVRNELGSARASLTFLFPPLGIQAALLRQQGRTAEATRLFVRVGGRWKPPSKQ